MLQISLEEFLPSTLVLALQGELSGPCAFELEIAWSYLETSHRGKACVLDLSKVDAIDCEGEEVVRRLARAGARIRAGGTTTSQIIQIVCSEQKRAIRAGQGMFTCIVSCALCF
jgi:hypothetical protein